MYKKAKESKSAIVNYHGNDSLTENIRVISIAHPLYNKDKSELYGVLFWEIN